MTLDLQSTYMKLLWAEVHVEDLKREVTEFFDNVDVYEIRVERHPETGEQIPWIKLPGDYGIRRLGLRIGDIVQSYRSALDHLVWALTIHNGHSPPANPIPFDSDWTRIQFPILDKHDGTKTSWDIKPPRALWGVTPKIAGRIEKLQPGYGGKDNISHALWKLNQLSIIDKHRALNVLALIAHAVRAEEPIEPGKVFKLQAPGPAEQHAELRRVSGDEPNVKMYFKVLTNVMFDKGEPTQYLTVAEVLELIRTHVKRIVTSFDTTIPPGLLAPP